MPKFIDLTGKTFGRWTVIDQAVGYPSASRQVFWNCRCSCEDSTVAVVGSQQLRSGHSLSCGCYHREVTAEIGKKNAGHSSAALKHGAAGLGGEDRTRGYRTWDGMIQRCRNPNATGYDNYGGRGVTVCERWLQFENFIEDMGEPPPGKTLERIKNHLGYSKENCSWEPRKVQNWNKRTNKRIMLCGTERLLAEVCQEYGISQHYVRNRAYRYDTNQIEEFYTVLDKKLSKLSGEMTT